MDNGYQKKMDKRKKLETLFRKQGYKDFKWLDPAKIVVSQWVRMKCLFGCGEFGHNACCPPNTPAVEACERFFREYEEAAVFHFAKKVQKPEDRHAWTRKLNAKLVKLERAVFISGYERVFLLYMDSCGICKDCAGTRDACKQPRLARPAPEAMAVDVYSTVRRIGYTVNVRAEYDQKMDRFAFLMIE